MYISFSDILNPMKKDIEVHMVYKNRVKRYIIPEKVAKSLEILMDEYYVEDVSKKKTILADPVSQNLLSLKTGHRVKKLREEHGLTQVELAEQLEIEQSNVSAIENNRRTVGIQIAQRLAKVFNLSYKIFLD